MTSAGVDWQREKWQSGFGSKFIRQGEKNAVKYADEIIVLSKGVQDYFKETYGRETHFIPNGVNRPQIRKANLITEKFGLKKDSYILFLGRLVPEKGIRYLVEAFKNVKTDKKLVIAGGSSDTDPFMEELKGLAKDDERILFTGFVQGAMLDELYSNAYIYTLPSDLEGMPLSLLEAMSYGNCCLVSDIPECAEVVEDKALIFKKADVQDLQEKLQDACDHAEATETENLSATQNQRLFHSLDRSKIHSSVLAGDEIAIDGARIIVHAPKPEMLSRAMAKMEEANAQLASVSDWTCSLDDLMAKPYPSSDTSIANQSSIVFTFEYSEEPDYKYLNASISCMTISESISIIMM